MRLWRQNKVWFRGQNLNYDTKIGHDYQQVFLGLGSEDLSKANEALTSYGDYRDEEASLERQINGKDKRNFDVRIRLQ